MFTTNQVCAAPVKVCAERVKRGQRPGHRRQFRQRQRLHRPAGHAGRAGHDRASLAQALNFTCRCSGARRLHRPHRRHHADGQRARRHHRGRDACWATPPSTRAAGRRGHHDQRHPAQADRGRVQAGRQDGPHRRHLQRRGHDPARHERHRHAPRRPATLHATMLCFITTDAAIEAQGACRPRCRKPWPTASTASPWTAT